MYDCPICASKLDIDYLNSIMDELEQNQMDGEMVIEPPCCSKKVRAFARIGHYYLKAADGSGKEMMIGAK